jgi:hypothetical protein
MHVNDAIKLTAASLVTFVLTAAYLRHERIAPSPIQYATVARPHVESSRVATGFPAQQPLSLTPKAGKPTATPVRLHEDPSDPDTERESRELEEFFGGVSNVAPVSPQQREALLQARLRHQKIFIEALRDSGALRDSLSDAERMYAHSAASRALADFRGNFMIDARAILSEEQFALLTDFEATEYSRRLAQLQIEINSK